MGKGQHNNSGGNMKRVKMMMMNKGMRCSYGLMLLLGFGAAVLGAMVLHKFRERRIFNLIIKEKDQQLFSLQLLLQTERDYVKETQKKTEKMRKKIYSLRTHKMNLDNRILEMRSTISSMRDEQKAIEQALEEKENEINQLNKRQLDYTKLTPAAEILSQKEAETERMKEQNGQTVKIWSVSADDPSNPQVNVTQAGESKEMAVKAVNYIGTTGNESASDGNEGKSSQGEDRIEIEGPPVRMETTGEEQIQKLEHTSEESMKNGSTTSGASTTDQSQGETTSEITATDHSLGENTRSSQTGGVSVDGNEENSSNETRKHKSSVEVGETRDNVEDTDNHLEVHASSVETGNDKSGLKYRSGIKLQMADNYALRMKHANRRKGKGKKAGNIAKHRMLESTGRTQETGVVRIRGRRFVKRALESKRTKRQQDGENGEEKQVDAKTIDAFADVKLLKPEVSAVTRSMSNEGNAITDQPVEDVQEEGIQQITSETHNISSDELQLNKTIDGESKGTTRDAGDDNQTEDGQLDKDAGEVHTDYEDSVEEDKSSQGKSAEKDELPENLEAEDFHESDTDISRESSSTLEDDKEDKEETDEPDF